jgi:transposase
MNKYEIIVGIDVSKLKLDVVILKMDDLENHEYFQVENTERGIKKILKRAKGKALFCFEHTGNYSLPLCCMLEASSQDYWMAIALDIKRSKGIQRGKSDRADAKDIAYYAYTHLHMLKLTKLPEIDMQKIKLLLSERDKLVKAITTFGKTTECISFLPKEVVKETARINKQTVKLLQKQLVSVEQEIKKIVSENDTISKQLELVKSVPGVGEQTAINLIVKTQCFSTFQNSRQFACYAGIAPFEYTSGSSVRGRTKVSPIADKKMKALISIAALSAKKWDMELNKYYHRKLEEGKNPMLVMNNIRNKMIARVFVVINRGTPFVNTQKFCT